MQRVAAPTRARRTMGPLDCRCRCCSLPGLLPNARRQGAKALSVPMAPLLAAAVTWPPLAALQRVECKATCYRNAQRVRWTGRQAYCCSYGSVTVDQGDAKVSSRRDKRASTKSQDRHGSNVIKLRMPMQLPRAWPPYYSNHCAECNCAKWWCTVIAPDAAASAMLPTVTLASRSPCFAKIFWRRASAAARLSAAASPDILLPICKFDALSVQASEVKCSFQRK